MPKSRSTRSSTKRKSSGTNALIKINREAARLKASNPKLEHRKAIAMASKKYNQGLLR